jgi:hypothetical protein
MRVFKSPDDLLAYSESVASEMEEAGFELEASSLRSVIYLPCSSVWEWLGEIGMEISRIEAKDNMTDMIKTKLSLIKNAAKSGNPYG